MTKDELVDLIERLYLSYNDQLPSTPATKNKRLEIWWEHLHDLDLTETKRAINWHKMNGPFIPKPMAVRITTIEQTHPTVPPTLPEAWSAYLELVNKAASGNWAPAQLHPALQTTVSLLAGTKLGTSSPKDREYFLDTYQQTLTNWRSENYQTKNL